MYGERLKFLRKERKIPQKDLAELLGISIRGYQFYESENNEPNIAALVTLADFYGVTIDSGCRIPPKAFPLLGGRCRGVCRDG